jgi:hypothetical protein
LGLDYTQKKAIWEQETVKMRKEVGALVSPFTTNIFGGVITQLVGLEKRPVTAEVAGVQEKVVQKTIQEPLLGGLRDHCSLPLHLYRTSSQSRPSLVQRGKLM